MTKEINDKTIVISPAAAKKMSNELKENHRYQVEIAAFNWCGPIYRLVQAKETGADALAMKDPESGIIVYASPDEGEFFESLAISLDQLFSDEVLMVRERV